MSSDDLVKILTPSLGQEKARAVVGSALKGLGLTSASDLTYERAKEVLEEVGKEGGLVSAAAKIAGLRLEAAPR